MRKLESLYLNRYEKFLSTEICWTSSKNGEIESCPKWSKWPRIIESLEENKMLAWCNLMNLRRVGSFSGTFVTCCENLLAHFYLFQRKKTFCYNKTQIIVTIIVYSTMFAMCEVQFLAAKSFPFALISYAHAKNWWETTTLAKQNAIEITHDYAISNDYSLS